jgi:predicted nucleic acid-binding protein
MGVEYVIDTNVLVYAATGRDADEWKRQKALSLIETASFATSGQILQEFFVTVTTKVKARMSGLDAVEWIDRLATCPVVPVDAALVKSAALLAVRHRISQWDAAVVAAAEHAGAPTLYSEDLNHGQAYGSVRVLNPFREH